MWRNREGRLRSLKALSFYVLVSLLLAPSCKGRSAAKPSLTTPTTLTATAVSTAWIDLAWSPVALDAWSAEIERSTNGVTFAPIATVPAAQTTYSDTGLTSSTRYWYRVRYAQGGNKGAYSPVASAVTIVVSGLTTTGGPTAGLMGHTAVYDSSGNRMIVFGGLKGTGVTDELWILNLTTNSWSQVPKGVLWPSARMGHSAILDTTYNRIILFGGYDGTPGDENDEVWFLDLSGLSWDVLTTAGPSSPLARQGHAAIFDAPNQRMIVFGGADVAISYNDVWALGLPAPPSTLNPSAWTELTPAVSGPAPRSDLSAVYDPGGAGGMIVFGGQDTLTPAGPFKDVWSLSLGATPAWVPIPAAGGPSARFGHSAVLNGAKMLVFGGSTGTASAELWQLNLAATPVWDPVPLGLPAPGARLGHTQILLPSTMILFAGGTSPGTPTFFDAWHFGL